MKAGSKSNPELKRPFYSDLILMVRRVDARQDLRTWKGAFHKAYNRVETAMEPLLHGWLQKAENGEHDLRRSRTGD